MDRKIIAWAAPVVVVVLVGGFLLYKHFSTAPMPVEAVTQTPAPDASAAEPEDHFPVSSSDAANDKGIPLPALNDSDAAARAALEGFADKATLDTVLIPNDLVRHLVVTIDNLPRKKIALQLLPVKPVGGALVIAGADENLTLSPDNYVRYVPLVKLMQGLNVEQFGTAYRRFYPLLQQAYQDLGYPKGYFNDRLVQVIDNLLATPEVGGPLKLVQPSVDYQYADPNLEALSAGQKTLLRMGPENTAIVKGKLRELRAEITRKQ